MDVHDDTGDTALRIGTRAGHASVVAALVAGGADVDELISFSSDSSGDEGEARAAPVSAPPLISRAIPSCAPLRAMYPGGGGVSA